MQAIICARILELIGAQAVYKFVAHSGSLEDSEDAMMVRPTIYDMGYRADPHL